jgi:ATP sulfurylase
LESSKRISFAINATVDWSKRDDVRAKLRLTVKKKLMRYGYPPDLAKMEADKVFFCINLIFLLISN